MVFKMKVNDEDVIHNSISDSLKNLEDLFNTSLSTGKISGGEITDNGDGTVSVSAGHGYIRPVDEDNGEILFCDWDAVSSLSLTNNATNYIYVDYNSGSPTITASTTFPADHNTKILLGLVYKEGTLLHITTAGQVVSNYNVKTFFKDVDINGKFQRVSGMMISEKSNRKFAISEGTIYVGLTKTTFPAFDSSTGDTFTYYYRDGSGGWTKVTGQTQIDNLHYDDGSGTLAELSNPTGWRTYYGVHWVYVDNDGHVFVLYGRGDYLLSEAESATPPSDIPPILQSIGRLVGKIIIEKNANSFEAIYSPFETEFTPSVVTDHNLLGGLQGGTTDEYYHLNSSDYTEATSFLDGGSKTHTEVDSHINDTTIHYTKDSINLQDLGNVNSSMSPTDGQVLKWNGTNSYWTAADESGGGSSEDINVESLAGDKTLTDSDAKYQWLDPNGANRTITLSTSCSSGKVFVIKNTAVSSYNSLNISDGTNTLDYIYGGTTETFIFDGTNWKAMRTDTALGIGYNSQGYNYGIGIGYASYGYNSGVAIGYYAYGLSSSVGIGYNANAVSNSVAIGYDAFARYGGVSIGYSVHSSNLPLVNPNKNILIGYKAGSNLGSYDNNNIVIGYDLEESAGTSNKLNIGNTLIGDLSTKNIILQGTLRYKEITTDSSSSGSATIDFSSSNLHTITLTEDTTFTFTDPGSPSFVTLIIKQDSTGGHSVTFPSSVKWEGSTAPTFTTTANATDIVSMLFDGTNYYASATLNFG